MSSISRFHIQIIQLFAFVFVWVHWDACLQYGACASQPPSRYTQPFALTAGWAQEVIRACLLVPGMSAGIAWVKLEVALQAQRVCLFGCSSCWVYASGLKDRGIFEKYSWAVLKAWSETITAGRCPLHCNFNSISHGVVSVSQISLSLLYGMALSLCHSITAGPSNHCCKN